MPRYIVVYSHGFGVLRDDRGLFTDIATSLPGAEHIMFDYNHVDKAANTLTVAPLDTQADRLLGVIADARAKHPDAIIDLICHSQGCIVAALACPSGVRKTILAAPPAAFSDTENKIKEICIKYGIIFTKQDAVRLPRKDGSTTVVPPEYWRVRDGLDAQEMYGKLAERTELTIITATQDEVLGEVNFDRLSSAIRLVEMPTGHNFEGEARGKLCAAIAELI
jgi:pimeloyl-ACP methyl ester carboxylesterase